jgi:hypothetical protein
VTAEDFYEDDEPVADLLAKFDAAEVRGVTGRQVCEPVVDSDGTVLGHAQVSPDLDERGRAALVEVVKAAIRLQEEKDAADPVGAAERAERQRAAIARVRARAGLRGEG